MKPRFLIPRREKQVSPRTYQEISKVQQGNISSVDIVPPQLGRRGDFGRLNIRFKTPVLG